MADRAGGLIGGSEAADAFKWLCTLQPSIQRATDMARGLHEDVTGFLMSGIDGGIHAVLGITGLELGNVDLAGLIDQGVADIHSGTFSAAAWTARVVTLAKQQIYRDAAAPAGATDAERTAADIARSDPLRMNAEVEQAQRQGAAAMAAAEAQDNTTAAQSLVATSIARGDEQRLVDMVTRPDAAMMGEGGTADVAQRRGRDANSSRAAIQALVQAQADYMRQQAVSDANVVTAVKEQALQQVYTTQQLAVLAQSVAQQQADAYNAWREEYYAELADAMAQAEALQRNMGVAIQILSARGR